MKKFIMVEPEYTTCTYRGYMNYVNVDKIIYLYKTSKSYFAIVEVGSETETVEITMTDYYELTGEMQEWKWHGA